MRPDDFWGICPCEATEFLTEADRRMLEKSWWAGRLHHSDPKKYPKKPELLWDPEADKQSPAQLFKMALALASNGAEIRKAMAAKKKMH